MAFRKRWRGIIGNCLALLYIVITVLAWLEHAEFIAAHMSFISEPPSWFMFLVLAIGLGFIEWDKRKQIAVLIAEKKSLEEQVANRRDANKICEQLSIQMMQGKHLMAKCTYPERLGRPTEDEINSWQSKTDTIVRKELGSVYFALYDTPDMNPPIHHSDDSVLNSSWNGIRFRVANLKKIVEELNTP